MLGHFKFKKQTLALLCVAALLLTAVPVLGAAAASVNTPVTIPNGDMESASGWKDTGSGSASTTLEYVSGGHSGKALSVTNTSADTQLEMSTERVAVEPGATYTISAWVKGSTNGTRLPIYIYEYAVASGGSVVKQTTGDTATVYYAIRGWQQISLTVTLQATTNYIRPRFICTTPANGAYLIDEIVLIKVAEETESAQTVDLIKNGDMSTEAEWNLPGGASATMSYIADGGHDGQALYIACTDPTPDVTTDTYDVTVRPGRVQVRPNTTYTISWWIKYSTATRYSAQIVEYNSENVATYDTQSEQIHYNTEWANCTYTFTTGDDAAEILPQIRVYQMNSTRDVYLDDISLTTTVDIGENAIFAQTYDDGVGSAICTNAVSGVRKNANGTVTLDANGVFPDVNGVSGAAAAMQFTGTNNQALFRPNGATTNTIAATANTDYIFRAKVKASAAGTAQLSVLRTGTSQVASTLALTAGEWQELEFAFNTSTATSVWPQIVLKPTTAATADAPVVFMVDDIEIVAAAPYCSDISVYTGHGIVPEKDGSVFIGWYSDAALTTAATSGAAYAKFMTAAEVGAATLDLNGTAIRNTTDLTKQGLYFRTVFKNASYLQYADIVEFGVLMLPENLLGTDAALTIEDTQAARLYADKAEDVALLKTGSENMTCSLSNAVAGTRFQRQITARPYALLADGTAMYGEQKTSSVAFVASTLANQLSALGTVDASAVSELLTIEDTALTYDQTVALIEFCVANYTALDV